MQKGQNIKLFIGCCVFYGLDGISGLCCINNENNDDDNDSNNHINDSNDNDNDNNYNDVNCIDRTRVSGEREPHKGGREEGSSEGLTRVSEERGPPNDAGATSLN